MEIVKKELEDMIYFFGYAKSHLDPDNVTGFFEYDKETDLKHQKNYMGYKKLTQSHNDWVSEMSDDMLAEFQYQMSDPAKQVDLLSYASSNFIT